MILGNKSDMEEKRVVSTERGEAQESMELDLWKHLQKQILTLIVHLVN